MNIIALDLPTDPQAWPGWLEQQLVGLELRDLVEQLEILQGGPEADVPKLEQVMGEQWDRVRSDGLRVLPPATIADLIRHPRILFELQQRVLEDGGEYWERVPRSERHRQLVQAQRERLAAALTFTATNAESPKLGDRSTDTDRSRSLVAVPSEPLSVKSHRMIDRRWLLATAALAAAMLLALLPWYRGPNSQKFFARPGLLAGTLREDDFFRQAADAIEADWDTTVSDPQDLTQQLAELRNSCNELLAADLANLSANSRAELKGRCARWRDTFSQQLQRLSEDPGAFQKVQADANATVAKLVSVLRQWPVAG